MWLFLVLLIPSGVLGGSASASPVPSTPKTTPTTNAEELTFVYNETDAEYSDLSQIPLEVLNITCNELNIGSSIVYVNSFESEQNDGPNKRDTSSNIIETVEGPNKNAFVVNKRHILETDFHSPCPVDLTKCDKGFTIAMWLSYVAGELKWAESWPPTKTCKLASINNNIVITSNTESGSQKNELHIDFKTNGATKKGMRLTLSSVSTDLMKPHVKVCKIQSEEFNCSKGSGNYNDDNMIKIGWQWNYFALSGEKLTQGQETSYAHRCLLHSSGYCAVKQTCQCAEPGSRTLQRYSLRAYYNGNPLNFDNISLEATDEESFSEGNGLILNGQSCVDIGFDDFAMWNRSLTEAEITKLRIAEFCEEKTTERPQISLAAVVNLDNLPKNITKEDAKNATIVVAATTAINEAFQAIIEAGNVQEDDVKRFTDKQLETVKQITNNPGLFEDPNVPDDKKKEAATNVVEVLDSALQLTDQTDMADEDKSDLAADVLETLDELALTMMETADELTINTDGTSIRVKPLPDDAEELTFSSDSGQSVSIPRAAFPKAADGEERSRAVVTTLKFNQIQNILSTVLTATSEKAKAADAEPVASPKLGTDVVSIRLNGYTAGETLSEPIEIDMAVKLTKDEQGETNVANCVSDSSPDGKWSWAGLKKVEASATKVKCQTTHLTNFAVLMAVTDLTITPIHAETLSTLTIVCTSISLVALFIAILILFIFRELSGTRISILKHLCIAMFIAQLVFITAIEKAAYNRKLCLVIAVFIHYLWLSVFFWMLAQGLFLYMKLRVAVRSDANIVWFCLIGWGFPAVMVTVTAGINIKAYGRDDLCWLNLNNGGAWAFVGPVLGVVMINCVVIVMAMKAFTSVKSFKDKADKDKFRSTLKAMIVMLPILGLSWIFGIFANIPGAGVAFSYIFSICNGLQGFFLFVFHIVFNAEVQRVVKRALLKRSSSVGAGEEPSFFRKMLGGDTEVTQTSQFSKSSSM